MNPAVAGTICGLSLAGVSMWRNVARADLHEVSPFPDLFTLLLVVAVFIGVLRWQAGGVADAGRRLAIAAAGSFGLAIGVFAWAWLPSHPIGLAVYAAITSFIFALIIGFVASIVCAIGSPRPRIQ